MAITFTGFPRVISVAIAHGVAVGGTATLEGGNLAPGDTLLSVRHCSADLVTNADVTGQVSSISGRNKITFLGTSTASTGNYLIVTYAKAAGS